jgi:hypothetical protein
VEALEIKEKNPNNYLFKQQAESEISASKR